MSRTKLVLAGFLAIGLVGAAVTALYMGYTSARNPAPTPPPAAAKAAPPAPEPTKEAVPIKNGDTLDELLKAAGVVQPARQEMVVAVQKAFDVRKFRAGTDLTLVRSPEGVLQSVEYVIDPDHRLQLTQLDEGYAASVEDIPGVVREVPVCGALRGSLFESMEDIGERAELTLEIADIFAWDLDFYTDPQEGDQFCVLVEKKMYDNGQPPTYRRILAATYNNAGTNYDAFLFPGKDGKPYYYAGNGHSLQSAFLHSPLKFEARISSHFSRLRFHPVLKIYRPHLGTDYAAPTGTPVQAVASGKVTFSGLSGGSGNMVRIRHTNGYETLYLHLSRRLVKVGQQVNQGERIGLVGATGLATGPHLDFRMNKNGQYVNFEHLKLPPTTQITAQQHDAFVADRDRYMALIETAVKATKPVLASGASADITASAP